MEEVLKQINSVLGEAVSWLWGWPLIIMLLGTHLFLTFRLGLPQRYLGLAIKLSVRRPKNSKGDINPFSALTTALAATLGAGNIVGVAAAVTIGGPGAVFWMWITGVFGIATKYSEALLSVKYRTTNSRGEVAGGPMYVIERGMGMKWLAVLFAIFTAIAGFGIGNMFQGNSVADLADDTLGLERWVTGLILAGLTAAVILGGIKSIARVTTFLVPIMAGLYILGCIILLIMNAPLLPQTVWLILSSAFTGQAAVGGFSGAMFLAVLRSGVARGLFSNEAGLGSAPIVAAAAETPNPVRQALVSATGTFWDTVVVCALTGLVVVSSGMWHEIDPNSSPPAVYAGADLTRAAFSQLGVIGPYILTFGLATFVLSTILGWSYYGEKALEYLVGTWAVVPYRWVWVVVVFIGATVKSSLVLNFSDLANGLMAIPNLISLIVLSGVLVSETRKWLPDFVEESQHPDDDEPVGI